MENADQRNYCVSFDKIRDELGFEASRDLGYGIGELKRAFEQKEIVDYTDARYHNQKFLKMSGTPLCKEELDAHLMAAFAAAPKGNHVSLRARGNRIYPRRRARALALALQQREAVITEEPLNRQAVLVLLVQVLAYRAFRWAGWCEPVGINAF